MRHDPGLTPAPYVAGTLLAVRRVADAVASAAASTPCCSRIRAVRRLGLFEGWGCSRTGAERQLGLFKE